VSAAICAALASAGERVAAFKPVLTGVDEPGGEWPRDDALLASVASAGQMDDAVTPLRFGPAVSPHYAAELAGEPIDAAGLAPHGRSLGEDATLIVEGVGGFLVPLSGEYLIRDLAVELALPVVIVARTGLGTINHTLLTIGAVRAAGLEVAAVVMTPWPADPAPIELSNRLAIGRLGRVEVVGLAPTRPDSGALAAAGAELPLEDWLS